MQRLDHKPGRRGLCKLGRRSGSFWTNDDACAFLALAKGRIGCSLLARCGAPTCRLPATKAKAACGGVLCNRGTAARGPGPSDLRGEVVIDSVLLWAFSALLWASSVRSLHRHALRFVSTVKKAFRNRSTQGLPGGAEAAGPS